MVTPRYPPGVAAAISTGARIVSASDFITGTAEEMLG